MTPLTSVMFFFNPVKFKNVMGMNFLFQSKVEAYNQHKLRLNIFNNLKVFVTTLT